MHIFSVSEAIHLLSSLHPYGWYLHAWLKWLAPARGVTTFHSHATTFRGELLHSQMTHYEPIIASAARSLALRARGLATTSELEGVTGLGVKIRSRAL